MASVQQVHVSCVSEWKQGSHWGTFRWPYRESLSQNQQNRRAKGGQVGRAGGWEGRAIGPGHKLLVCSGGWLKACFWSCRWQSEKLVGNVLTETEMGNTREASQREAQQARQKQRLEIATQQHQRVICNNGWGGEGALCWNPDTRRASTLGNYEEGQRNPQESFMWASG